MAFTVIVGAHLFARSVLGSHHASMPGTCLKSAAWSSSEWTRSSVVSLRNVHNTNLDLITDYG